MPQRTDVVAAGVVAFGPGRRVLLVHRPAYDDWSFPKGKLDPGEHAAVAAVREVAEETGVHVRLGRPLGSQRYPVAGRGKTVHYWVGWPVGDHDVSGYLVNDEIDEVVWVATDEAGEWLTYERDRETLAEATRARKKTRALVTLRHGKARSRKSWSAKRPDTERPLVSLGHHQAQRLVALLAAYDVTRLASSLERALRADPPAVRRQHRLGARARRGPQRGGGRAARRSARRWRTCSTRPAARSCARTDRCSRTCSRRSAWTRRSSTRRPLHRPPPPRPGRRDRGPRPSLNRLGPASIHDAGRRRPVDRRHLARPRSRCVHRRPRVRTPALPTFAVSCTQTSGDTK